MVNIKKSFGNNLKIYRNAQGYTQESFAEKINLSVSALSKIESGKNYPEFNTLDRIINVLNIPPYLLYLTNDDNFDIDKAYDETLELLKDLKKDKDLFKRVYDLTCELSSK